MTTDTPRDCEHGRPLFGCQYCYEDVSWPADDLRLFEGEPICVDCYDGNKLYDGGPEWGDLPEFIPAHVAEIAALRAEIERLKTEINILNCEGRMRPFERDEYY